MRKSERTSFEQWERLFNVDYRSNLKNRYLDLINHYSEELRHYHTLVHIEDCLIKFDRVKKYCQNPHEVEIAIWSHDIIYNPKRTDNEQKSAEWASDFLREIQYSPKSVQLVSSLIIATANHYSEKADSLLLNDIDLSILGSASQTYRVYREDIRKEYRHVPDFLYKQGRAKVLRSFMEKEKIYHTEFFCHLEGNARKNINDELKFLQANNI